MSVSEFDSCFEELDKLRCEFLDVGATPSDGVTKPVIELAQNHLSCLQAMTSLFDKFSINRFQADCAISMPDPNSVLNFVELVKTGLELGKGSDYDEDKRLDKHFASQHNAHLNRLSGCELNNNEFNRNFLEAVRYFEASPEIEDLAESTVNTIRSDDVLASSPI